MVARISFKRMLYGLFTLIIVIVAFLYMNTDNKKIKVKHKAEIEKVITERGGMLISIEEMPEDAETPFDGLYSWKYNVIYRVTYKKGQTQFISWYRAVMRKDIHDQKPYNGDGFGEQWIFKE